MELFRIVFIPVTVIDVLDVLAVTFVFYQVYRIMRGTRATQMFAGLLVLLAAGSLAQLLGMSGMSWLIQSIGAVWVIAFVILFQPELRRMLIRIGQFGVLRTLFRTGGEKMVAEVCRAVIELSKKRFGGLIVFQRSTGVRGVIETGVLLQAEVSWELLVSIFHPRTPLHDGAVIISSNSIVAAACILPLSTAPQPDETMGTRHRAALGISGEIDAVVVVVSEETGTISIAEGGHFIARDLDEKTLRDELIRKLYPGAKVAKSEEPEPEAELEGIEDSEQLEEDHITEDAGVEAGRMPHDTTPASSSLATNDEPRSQSSDHTA